MAPPTSSARGKLPLPPPPHRDATGSSWRDRPKSINLIRCEIGLCHRIFSGQASKQTNKTKKNKQSSQFAQKFEKLQVKYFEVQLSGRCFANAYNYSVTRTISFGQATANCKSFGCFNLFMMASWLADPTQLCRYRKIHRVLTCRFGNFIICSQRNLLLYTIATRG